MAPLCPCMGEAGTSYCFLLSLLQAHGVGSRDLCFWLRLEVGGGGGHPCANPGAHQVSLGCR